MAFSCYLAMQNQIMWIDTGLLKSAIKGSFTSFYELINSRIPPFFSKRSGDFLFISIGAFMYILSVWKIFLADLFVW